MATVTEAFDLFDKWVSDGCEYHPLLISELQGAFAEARAEVECLRSERLAWAEMGAKAMQHECSSLMWDDNDKITIRAVDALAIARCAVDAEDGG